MMHFRPISDQNILDEGYNTIYTTTAISTVHAAYFITSASTYATFTNVTT